MITLSSRRSWLASIPTTLLLGATALHAQSAGVVVPAGGVLRATLTEVPADRIHLNTDQVRLLLAAHHPAIVDGVSDDNSVTIILSSNGSYLASSATKVPMATASVGRSGGGGGVIVASAGGGARSGGGGAGGAGGAVGGFSARGTSGGGTATASPAAAGEVRRVSQMTFPGIGTIDSDVVHDTYFTSYEAGELVASPVRVRFVVLVPNAVIK